MRSTHDMAQISSFVVGAVVVAVVLSSCTGVGDEEELPAPKVVSEVGPIDALAPPEALLQDDVLLVSTLVDNNRVEAFDISSGESLWDIDEVAGGKVWVADGFVVFLADTERVEIRDLTSGELRDEITLEPENSAGEHAALLEVTGTTLFLANPKEDIGEVLSAVDIETGDQLWERDISGDDALDASPSLRTVSSSSNPDSDLVPVTNAKFSTIALHSRPDEVTAFDAATGKDLWGQARYSNAPGYTLVLSEDLAATVDVNGDKSCRHTLQVSQTESGDVNDFAIHRFEYDDKWRCEDGSAIVSDGTLVLGQDADRRPQAIDLATGDEIWTAEETGEPLALVDGTASYQTTSGDVVTVDVKSGNKQWDSDVLPDGRGVIADDMLLISNDSETVATALNNGNPRWHKKDASVLTHDDAHIAFSREASDGIMIAVTTHDPH